MRRLVQQEAPFRFYAVAVAAAVVVPAAPPALPPEPVPAQLAQPLEAVAPHGN